MSRPRGGHSCLGTREDRIQLPTDRLLSESLARHNERSTDIPILDEALAEFHT